MHGYNASQITVRANSSDVYDVEQIHLHPGYKGYKYSKQVLNNLALLELKENVSTGSFLKIGFEAPEPPETVILTRWERQDNSTSFLFGYNLPVFDRKECEKIYNNLWRSLERDKICTLSTKYHDCEDFAGAALVDLDKEYLFGIYSTGYPTDKICRSKNPLIYTSVVYHRDWIYKIIGPDEVIKDGGKDKHRHDSHHRHRYGKNGSAACVTKKNFYIIPIAILIISFLKHYYG